MEMNSDMLRAYKAARFDRQRDNLDGYLFDVPAHKAWAAIEKCFRPRRFPYSFGRGTDFWHWTPFYRGRYVQRPLAQMERHA